MKVKIIPSSWLVEEEHRLDCNPFTSGGIEARKTIQKLDCPKQPLVKLTKNGINGIYHVGQDKLQWVEDSTYGVPLLRSSDILKADLSNQPYISKKQVKGNSLFQCPAGTTLITRSGTIGRMAYTRSEMAEMAISQDVLKVVPDTQLIPSGYLYAFLSSRFGIPQIVGGTFGSIIVHIEAENIEDLPVPRLGEAIEQKTHTLVQEAADKRTKATQLLNQSQQLLREELKLAPIQGREKLWTAQNSCSLRYRFDAYYYSEANKSARQAFNDCEQLVELQEVATVFIPGIFKRRYADDPNYGYPYITGADIFTLAPTSEQFLMRSVAERFGLVLKKGMILIHEAGQLSGLIGHSVQVGSYLDGFACTNNVVRVTPHNSTDTGYLFTVLASEYGVRLIQRESAGSSIPHIEVSRVQRLAIPWAEESVRLRIGQPAEEAQKLRDEACELEAEARILIETTIENLV